MQKNTYGKAGEIIATNYLKEKNYRIIATNYKNKIGCESFKLYLMDVNNSVLSH